MSGAPDGPIAILGAGAFGSALALALADRGGPVTLWGRGAPRWPEGAPPPPANLRVTNDLPEAESPVTLLALPAQVLGGFLGTHAARLNGRALISCAKGIDLATLTGPSRLIAAACPAATVAVLTGPSSPPPRLENLTIGQPRRWAMRASSLPGLVGRGLPTWYINGTSSSPWA